MSETHVIRKEDLLEMLSRFDNKLHIDVLAGETVLNIDRAEYGSGSISIICHNDIEDLEETIDSLRLKLSNARRDMGFLIHNLQMRDDTGGNSTERTVAELQEIKETMTE